MVAHALIRPTPNDRYASRFRNSCCIRHTISHRGIQPVLGPSHVQSTPDKAAVGSGNESLCYPTLFPYSGLSSFCALISAQAGVLFVSEPTNLASFPHYSLPSSQPGTHLSTRLDRSNPPGVRNCSIISRLLLIYRWIFDTPQTPSPCACYLLRSKRTYMLSIAYFSRR
jgi:hypothetical protein